MSSFPLDFCTTRLLTTQLRSGDWAKPNLPIFIHDIVFHCKSTLIKEKFQVILNINAWCRNAPFDTSQCSPSSKFCLYCLLGFPYFLLFFLWGKAPIYRVLQTLEFNGFNSCLHMRVTCVNAGSLGIPFMSSQVWCISLCWPSKTHPHVFFTFDGRRSRRELPYQVTLQ